MGQITTLVPKGIARNTPDESSVDGSLLEAINIRYHNGAWRGVGEKQATGKKYISETVLSHICYHPVLPNDYYIVYVEAVHSVVKLKYNATTGEDTTNPLVLAEGDIFDRFAVLGNVLIVWCTNKKYMLYWKDTEYIDVTSIPLPLIQAGESDNTTQSIVTETITSPDPPDYGFGPIQNIVEYLRQELEGLYEKNRVEKTDLGYANGLFQIRVAFRLYDGNYILHSVPLLHYAGFNSMEPELFVDIAGSDYTGHLYYISMAKASLYYSFTEAQADLLQPFLDSGVIESMDIFVTRLKSIHNIGDPINKWSASTAVNWKPPTADDIKLTYETGQLYKAASVKLSDLLLKAATGDFAGDYENINGNVLLTIKDSIAIEELLPIDSFTHHTLLAACDYEYNSRQHIGNIKALLSAPLVNLFNLFMPVKKLDAGVFDGWVPQITVDMALLLDLMGSYNSEIALTTAGLVIYQQIWLTTDEGKKTITSELPKTLKFIDNSSKGAINTPLVITDSGPMPFSLTPDFEFNTALIDTLSALDTTAHTFTAPSTGDYSFEYSMNIHRIFGTASLLVYVGVTLTDTFSLVNGVNTGTSTIHLTASDVVTFKIKTDSEDDAGTERIDTTVYAGAFILFALSGASESFAYCAYTDGTNKALVFNNMVSYPDYRATNIRLFYIYDSVRYFLKDFKLTPCIEGNYAYNLTALSTDKVYPCTVIPLPSDLAVGTAMPLDDVLVDNNIVHDTNLVKVSAIKNPFFWDALKSYRFGLSHNEVTDLSTVQAQMSDAKFGQYPLYVFTQSGIDTLEHGTGEVLYSNIQPLNNEILIARGALCPISGSIVYATREGIRVISGSEVNEISVDVEGSISNPLAGLTHFHEALTGLHMPQIDLFRSDVTFLTYLPGAKIFYDVENKEIIVSNPAYNYSYSYSLFTQSWATRTEIFTDMLFIAGRNIAVKTDLIDSVYHSSLHYLDAEDTTEGKCEYYLLQTRPVNLANSSNKHINRLISRCKFTTKAGEYSIQMIAGSNDLNTWKIISYVQYTGDKTNKTNINTFGNFKYFMIVIAGYRTGFVINQIDVDWKERFGNKLR